MIAWVALPFELVGQLPGPWDDDCAEFIAQAESHPWGGPGPERLVLVELVQGGFIDAVERYMEDAEFQEWLTTVGAEPRIAGKTFRASDGKVTTVLLPLPDHAMFFTFFPHQALEAAALHRQHAEGYQFPSAPSTVNSHVLWRHYAAERARRELTESLGWDLGDFDQTELVSESKEVEAALIDAAPREPTSEVPGVPAQRVWITMLRLWSAALGNADGGALSYALELRRFEEQPFVVATQDAWPQAADTLRHIWAAPERPTIDHDAASRRGFWEPMRSALQDTWDNLREQE